jgi:hypothetical protein
MDGIAGRLEGKSFGENGNAQESLEHLERAARKVDLQQPRDPREAQVHALLVLSRRSEQLTTWLAENT